MSTSNGTKKCYRMIGDNFEMTVEIDHAVMTEEKLHEINNFWTSPKSRVADRGTVLHAVLALLFQRVQRVVVENPFGLNVHGVLYAFEWKGHCGEPKNGEEGWPEMDGRHGIRIVSVTDVDLDEEPVISEVTA